MIKIARRRQPDICFLFRLNRDRSPGRFRCLRRLHVDLELTAAGLLDFRLENWIRRRHLERFDGKLFCRFHGDGFRLRFFAALPIKNRGLNFEQLRDGGLERENGRSMRRVGIVSLHRHGFNLQTGAVANVERGGDLTLFARRDLVFLCLRRCASARGMHRFKMNRRVADVFVFEMADRLLVANRGMQIDLCLFPFQFRARGGGEKHQECESENVGFHFFEYES